jgi:hypothetical protein
MDTSKKKKMTQGPVGTRIPIQKKTRTHKKSQHGSTRNPPRTEQAPRETTEQVHAEEIRTETQEKPVEEEIG